MVKQNLIFCFKTKNTKKAEYLVIASHWDKSMIPHLGCLELLNSNQAGDLFHQPSVQPYHNNRVIRLVRAPLSAIIQV